MGRAEAGTSESVIGYETAAAASPDDVDSRLLLRQLVLLSLPILAENILSMLVGLTDVYVAGHLNDHAPAATAAVGSISYVLWLIGLLTATIGSGSTAIIARAIGARHRRLANSVCGQSVTAAVVMGLILSSVAFFGSDRIADLTGLTGRSHDYALFYLRMLSISLPFSTFLFAANACLRGAGDTVSPAVAMVGVDAVNAVLTYGLAFGAFGLPEMGFDGIAVGTVIAYVLGGLFQFAMLVRGRGGVRLHLHRLRPHWHTMRRILRIGLPSGAEGLITWIAQFAIVVIINRIDLSNVTGSAHIVAVRLEALSFMMGFAIAIAASTLVGQSLGMRNPRRATRVAYLAYALGGGVMGLWGLAFICFPTWFAARLTADPAVIPLSAKCLVIAGFGQFGFAASLVFGGALRGAGDTLSVMAINLFSVLLLRFVGVLVAVHYFHLGLVAIWVVLITELCLRGGMVFLRFRQGGWKRVQV